MPIFQMAGLCRKSSASQRYLKLWHGRKRIHQVMDQQLRRDPKQRQNNLDTYRAHVVKRCRQ